ncbi:MAG: hypothetical protein GY719_38970 [bacterium]|nr:hypothetical protein [bacterium]
MATEPHLDDRSSDHRSRRSTAFLLAALLLTPLAIATPAAAEDGREVIAKGAESYGPVTPIRTIALRDAVAAETWQPGDPTKEIPRRFFPLPGGENRGPVAEGFPDLLGELQLMDTADRAPSVTVDVNMDGQGFTGVAPPDTVGDVGPDHYVQAINASRIAVYDKTGSMEPGFPINLDSLAPGAPCTSGSGDPIVLYDWLADRWFLQEFTGGGVLCIYVSTTADPTGTYDFYSFTPPSFPDYPHYGVWPDAYYAATNEAGGGGNQTTYAFDRVAMLAGGPATMQRLTVVPPLSGYGFQTVTPADHDGDTAPPVGAPGIFMRHNDDEAHSGSPLPATDTLEMWEMDVDFVTPANTTVTALPSITISDFNSWMINYSTFFTTSQPDSGTLLDAIREVILQRLVYRNFGTHETLLGVFAANRDPATSGSVVEQGNRWFELRRPIGAHGPGAWTLHQEGTFGGDTNSSDANFFMGSVAMDGAGSIALGYSKTDVGGSPVFPSVGITGRLESDPAGTMGPENDIVLGGGASSSGRWGDYANMSIDPADDCTFWFTQEYIPVSGTWGTRIASFVFDECLFGFVLSPTPSTLDVCAPTDPDPTVDIDVTAVGGWSFSVDLSASSEPPSTTGSFSPDNMTPDFTSTYTLLGTGSSTTGTYSIGINGTGADVPATERSTSVVLNLAVAVPAAPTLATPADAATGEGLTPTLTWMAASDATSYDLEVATDAGFGNVVYSVTGLSGLSHTVATPLAYDTEYFWRVTADNVCGTTAGSAFSFTTEVSPGACPPGFTTVVHFEDDFESGAVGWTSSGTGDTWALDGSNVTSGANAYHADDPVTLSDQRLVSPAVVLPSPATSLTLQFQNLQAFETPNTDGRCWDAGILEITTDGGANWSQVPGSAMLTDLYDDILWNDTPGNNPISNDYGATDAWCDPSQPFTLSVVDLASWVGQTVQFRWRLGSDSASGGDGWTLDDVVVQSCDSGLIFTDGFESGDTTAW